VSLLDIRVLGDPILREETTPVTAVTDELRRLIDDMLETMYAAKGIGLAAPQVGRRERLTVIDVEDGPIVLVNPEIVTAEGRTKGEEGCLSIPEIYGDVERAARVVVRALDRDGKPFEIEGRELLARCLQHEIDHLHGRLFIDYLSVLKRRSALKKWEAEREKYPDNVRRLTPDEVASHHHRDEEL
jgi:peptide deformylase